MKKILFSTCTPLFLFLVAVLTAGCPVGVDYPLCEISAADKIDTRLLGTWRCDDESTEIIEVRIAKKDERSYAVEVLETGEMYGAEDTKFQSWITKLGGHNFIFSQGTEKGDTDYYLYEYSFDGSYLVIHDVGLLVGGVEAVTSTIEYQKEVQESLKMADCLSERRVYYKI